MSNSITAETVTLVVPAHKRFIATGRVLAGSLAVDLDMTVEAIDDLRIAIDELLTLLIEVASPGATITVTFDVDEDSLRVSAVGNDTDEPVQADDLTLNILSAVVDDHRIGQHAIELTKRRLPA